MTFTQMQINRFICQLDLAPKIKEDDNKEKDKTPKIRRI